jgi:hypothetical protein
MGEVSGRTARLGAGAVAAAAAGAAAALPVLTAGDARSVPSALALAGSVVVVQALVFAPALLPAGLALYGAECVVAVEAAGRSRWVVPAVGAALVLLSEAVALRARIFPESIVERAALRRAVRRIGTATMLAFAGATAVTGGTELPARGGAGAGLIGGAAAAAALLLVARLGRLDGRRHVRM